MSSIELIAAAVAMTAAPHTPAPTACPAMSAGVRLSDGTVYDGPIAENAILAPDSERRVRGGTVNRWPVAYVYAAGRQVYLSCAYRRQAPVIVRIARPVKECRYTVRGAIKSLACS